MTPMAARKRPRRAAPPAAPPSVDAYMHSVAGRAVAAVCHAEGFHRARTAALHRLRHLLHCCSLGALARENSELEGRSEVCVLDICRSFRGHGVTAGALKRYADVFALPQDPSTHHPDHAVDQDPPLPRIILPACGVPRPLPMPVYRQSLETSPFLPHLPPLPPSTRAAEEAQTSTTEDSEQEVLEVFRRRRIRVDSDSRCFEIPDLLQGPSADDSVMLCLLSCLRRLREGEGNDEDE